MTLSGSKPITGSLNVKVNVIVPAFVDVPSGAIASEGGVASIVHEYDAGTETLPTRSTARTWKTWPPSAKFVGVNGLVAVANALPSSETSKRAMPDASAPENVNVGDASFE